MATFNFGLLELADGESGEHAVSVIVSKAEAEADAAQAKNAEADAAADSSAANKDKAALKNFYFHKLQYENGISNVLHEIKRLREVLIKLRGEETKLKETGENGRHFMPLSEEQRELRLMQLSEEQRKLRQQQRNLRVQEAKLRALMKEFYLEHGIPLCADEEEPPYQTESVQGNDNAGVGNGNQAESVQGNDNAGDGNGYHAESVEGNDNAGDGNGCYHDGELDVHADRAYKHHNYGGNGCYHDGELDVHADGAYRHHNYGGNGFYHDGELDDHANGAYRHHNYSGRHNYNGRQRKVQKKYVVKVISDPVTSNPPSKEKEAADPPPSEENEATDPPSSDEVTSKPPSKEKEAASPNTDVAEGAVASNNGKVGPGIKKTKQKMNGSEKKKMKRNAKKNVGSEVDRARKQDSSEADLSKKTGKEPLVISEEQKKTLAEYERLCELKKKSVSDDTLTSEARKVSTEEFDGLHVLEKKNLDISVMKPEKNKASGKKEEKPPQSKKVATRLPLNELSFAPPRRVVLMEDGSSSGSGFRGRFNGRGGFHGHSRDNSTDSRVPAGRGSDNGSAGQDEEAANYGSGAPRGGSYSGGRDYSAPRGVYSGGRGDGAQGGGRGNGGGYNNQGGNGSGYQQRQGRFQRRPGNDSYYRPRGRGYSGNGRFTAPAPNPMVAEDMNSFPPLRGGAAPAAAPAQGPDQS